MALEQIGDDIWTAFDPSFKFFGLVQIGTRVTVVKLGDGSLLLHSPIRIDDELQAEIDAIGPVSAIVCPNQFHHMFAEPYVGLYPKAELYGTPSMLKRQKHLKVQHIMDEKFSTPTSWAEKLDLLYLAGTAFEETVFLHRESKTLITSDLIEYFTEHEQWFTRMYLKIMGTYKNPSFPKIVKGFYQDKPRAKVAFEQMLELDFVRMVIAHGNVMVEDDPKGVLRRTYSWLLD